MSTQPTQPARERLDRTPDWMVQAVFDPDGRGGDFAYTIGLHDRGLPELHLWARPDRGEDPGEDWALSMRDRTTLLNDIAWRLIDGRVEVGSEWDADFDGGEARAHFRVEPAGDRERLEAFGIGPDATVLPVSWSLTRPPVGPLTELDAEALAVGTAEFAHVALQLEPEVRGPGPWQVPETPDFAPEQDLGPLTPVVRARAAQMISADVTTWNSVLRAAASIDMDSSLTFPYVMARMAARGVGRVDCLDRLEVQVDELVAWLRDDVTRAPQWRAVMDSLFGPMSPEQRDHVAPHHEGIVRESVLTALAIEVVADVVDAKWLCAARGPWLRGLSPLAFPGPAWVASPSVQRTVLELLTPLAVEDLAAVADRHHAALDGCSADPHAYNAVFLRLDAWAVTSPAGCSWSGLAQVPAFEAFVGSLLSTDEGALGPMLALQEWASCVTAALTFRPRLSAGEVASFAEPFRDIVVGLEEQLNSPLVET